MVLGMSVATYTFVHALISLVGIGSGLAVMYGFLTSKRLDAMNALFLITTVATSVTGYGFPFEHLLPSHIVGAISLVVLAVAIPARYMFHLAGSWRWIYVATSAAALYFNIFVLVVQCFLKVPALKVLAPTQKEPPFVITQLVVLVLSVGVSIVAARRFRVERAIPQEIKSPRAA